MMTELIEEKERRILENKGLVFHLVNKLNINNPSEYEEFCSVGTIGLIKAANSYDETKGIAFSTYAGKCIQNELFMYLRKNKKHSMNTSLEAPISVDEIGNSISLGEITEDTKSNFVKGIMNKKDIVQIIHVVLNCLEGKNRIIMLYRIGDLKQKEIKEIINFSQSYIARIEKKSILNIRKVINNCESYQENFSVNLLEEEYKISFSLEDVGQSKESFTKMLKKITPIKNLPNFKVNCSNERVVIVMPADLDYFCLIAQLIQEIEKSKT